MKKIIVIALALVSVLVSAILVYRVYFNKIEYGYTGVKYNTITGEISECKGSAMVNPTTTNLYIYPNKAKKIDCDPIVLIAPNGLPFKIDLSLSYKIDSVTSFFRNRLCVINIVDNEHLPEILPESIEDFENSLRCQVKLAYYKAAINYPLDSLSYYSKNVEHDVALLLNDIEKRECVTIFAQANFPQPSSKVVAELERAKRELQDAEAALIKAQQEYELEHNKIKN